MGQLRNTERVLKNTAVEKLLATEKALSDKLSFADIAEEVAGVYPRHDERRDGRRWVGLGGALAVVGMLVSAASGALGEVSWRFALLPLFVGVPLFVGLVAVPAPKVELARARHLVLQPNRDASRCWEW